VDRAQVSSASTAAAFCWRGRHRSLGSMSLFRFPVPEFVTVYALLYAAFGVQSPFLPALLRERGLHAEEIGLVFGAATAIRVLAGPAIGHAADRRQRHTLMLLGCALLAATAGLGYVVLRGFWPLLLAALVQAAMLAPIVPLSDALATTAAHQSVADDKVRFEYGWLRGCGSAAFIVGTTLSGWAAGRAGLTIVPWVSGTILAVGGAMALLLPRLAGADTGLRTAPAPLLRDVSALLRLGIYRRMLIVAALVEGSHALQDTFAVIRWHTAGVDLATIGVLWSESVASEVLVFFAIGPRLVNRLGPGWSCAVAAGAGTVRWMTAAVTTSPVIMGLTQPLHGLTFALLHLACMRLIVQIAPIRLAATAQSIYGTFCIGTATALLTLASGLLYGRIGGRAFLVMAALCLVALPLCPGMRLSRMQQ
jgi:MFS transporter, PPP family, 3-phenylpropionic acid transporter